MISIIHTYVDSIGGNLETLTLFSKLAKNGGLCCWLLSEALDYDMQQQPEYTTVGGREMYAVRLQRAGEHMYVQVRRINLEYFSLVFLVN